MTMTQDMAMVLRGPWTARAAVLADLDGCLISGDTVLPMVPAFVMACGSRLWIVSNNSSDTAAGLSQRLAAMGLEIPAARILLAGEETLRALAAGNAQRRVALFAAPPLQALARTLGLRLVQDRPDIVVLARDMGFDMAALGRLAAMVHAGAALHLTNPDPSHPGPDGVPVPETGALMAALSAMVAPGPVACLGKPAPDLIVRALARAGVAPSAAVYVGDTPETDGVAAAAAGVEFLRVAPPQAAAQCRRAAGC